jgi:hypothetical protein
MKIYPEVKNSFEADVLFTGIAQRHQGQSPTVSSPSIARTPTVAKGGFFQQTGGRWVYLVSEDGAIARKAEVRMGRQNPREVEVLEGLREGDRICHLGTTHSTASISSTSMNPSAKRGPTDHRDHEPAEGLSHRRSGDDGGGPSTSP